MTRRSTTGLVVRYGMHVMKTSSTLQSTISLSSGEAEYYGLAKAASAGLGFQALMRDWNIHLPVEVETDSSAAKGFASRQGLGRLRHVQTRFLWLQERIRMQHLHLTKIKGEANVADVLTKVTAAARLSDVLQKIGFHVKPHEVNRPKTVRSGTV